MSATKPSENQLGTLFGRAMLIWGLNGFIFGLVELTVNLAFYPYALTFITSISWGFLAYPLLGVLLGVLISLLRLALNKIQRLAQLNWEAIHASLSLVIYNTLFCINWTQEIFIIAFKPIDPKLPFAQAGILALAGIGCLILYRFLSARKWGQDLFQVSIVYALVLDTLVTVGLHLNGLFIPEQLAQTPVVYNWFLVFGLVFMAGVVSFFLAGVRRGGWRLVLGVTILLLVILDGSRYLFKDQASRLIQHSSKPNAAKGLPNILIISLDALRPDHLSCYGYSRIKTPAIDSLANEGVRFERAMVQSPWTLASFSSIFSSLYPSVHLGGKINFGDERSITPLRPYIPWLPSILQELGYYTKAIITNGMLSETYGFVRGFDDFYNLFDKQHKLELVENKRGFLWHFLRFWAPPNQINSPTSIITEKSLKWLAEAPQPFFLWIHYLDPHLPYNRVKTYNLNPDYKGKLQAEALVRKLEPKQIKSGFYMLSQADKEYLKSVYDEEILFVDEQIGKLLNKLRETGQLEKTLIVLTSDHGEEFWEHKRYEHGHSLYREVVHIPLIIRYPKLLPKNLQVPYQVQSIDLTPTILDILGHPGVPLQGKSLLSMINGQETGHRPAYAEFLLFFEELKALDTGEYKFIFNPTSKQAELYDLRQDPQEQHNVIAQNPQIGRKLMGQLEKWRKECEKWAKSYKLPGEEKANVPDEVTRQRLKALGYL